MIKIYDGAVIRFDVNTPDAITDITEKIQKNENLSEIYFLCMENNEIIAALSALNLASGNTDINRFTLRFNQNVFINARDCFYSRQSPPPENSCIPVLDENGDYMFLMVFYENRNYTHRKEGYLYDALDSYNLVRDYHLLDLEIIENTDVFIFYELEEYTWAIASLITRFYPEKQVIFLDRNVRHFKDDSIKICDSLYETSGYAGRKVYITSKRHNEAGTLPDYLSHIYNSYNIIYSLLWCSKISSFGEKNPDKTILLLDYACYGGLVDTMRFTCAFLLIAKERGWIPVIDLSTFPNQYLNSEQDNMWEYFFEPVSEITVSEAYESKNVIVASENRVRCFSQEVNILQRKFDRYLWESCGKNSLFRDLVRLNAPTREYISNNIHDAFKKADTKILGVVARGTDFTKAASEQFGRKNHSKDINLIIQKSLYEFELHNCEYLFLATEDEEYLSKFIDVFKDKLIFVEQKRVSYDYANQKYVPVSQLLKIEDGHAFGKQYLLTLYCLSKCHLFLASMNCGASFVARSWNCGKYELDENI